MYLCQMAQAIVLKEGHTLYRAFSWQSRKNYAGQFALEYTTIVLPTSA